MADSNEEQLLNGLLRDIQREDTALDGIHLEDRVLVSWDVRSTIPVRTQSRVIVACAIAAAAVLMVMPTVFLHNRDASTSSANVETSPSQPAQSANAELPRTESSAQQSPVKGIAQSPLIESRVVRSPVPQPPVAQSQMEFVPLMPFSGGDLSGRFQIMRVQMPRASLGLSQSPFEHPHELIETDVLLGEDGMARAIRVSTSGSNYPWRSH